MLGFKKILFKTQLKFYLTCFNVLILYDKFLQEFKKIRLIKKFNIKT